MQALTKLYNGAGAFADVSSILPAGVPSQSPKRVVFIVPTGSTATIKTNNVSGWTPVGEGIPLDNTTGVQPYSFPFEVYDATETPTKSNTFNSLQVNVPIGRTLGVIFFW